MDLVVRPGVWRMVPIAVLLLLAAAAVRIIFVAVLRRVEGERLGDDPPGRVYLRRGLALAAVGVAIAIVGRLLRVGSPIVVQHIPLAMVALGGLSALRAFVSPAYAGGIGGGGSSAGEDEGLLSGGGAEASSAGAAQEGEILSVAKGLGDVRLVGAGRTLRGGRLRLGIGDADVDLVGARFPRGTHVLRVSIGLGDLCIRPPLGVPARIEASAGFGDIELGDQRGGGIAARLVREDDAYAAAGSRLLIVASVSIGDIRVP